MGDERAGSQWWYSCLHSLRKYVQTGLYAPLSRYPLPHSHITYLTTPPYWTYGCQYDLCVQSYRRLPAGWREAYRRLRKKGRWHQRRVAHSARAREARQAAQAAELHVREQRTRENERRAFEAQVQVQRDPMVRAGEADTWHLAQRGVAWVTLPWASAETRVRIV